MKAEVLHALGRWHTQSAADWEALALRLCAFQQAQIPPYAAFAGGARPGRWEDIPAVPVSLFRELRFCVSPTPAAVFRTSGTTGARRGEHALPDLDALDLASRLWFDHLLPGAAALPAVSLVPDPTRAPDSSLGHMIGQFFPGAQPCFDVQTGVDAGAAWEALRTATGPVFVASTAYALAQLLDGPGGHPLAVGSVVMITGGFKGRVSHLDEGALRREARSRLGPDARLVGEYGMTELSSQLWDVGDGYRAPPWLHVYAADPVQGTPLPEGQQGVLRFVDLASWGSCLAVETEDLGVVQAGRVHLHGRLREAAARGCSLTAEEAALRRSL